MAAKIFIPFYSRTGTVEALARAIAEGAESVPEKVEGMKNAPLIQGATSLQPLIDPKHPRPRPKS